MTLQFFASLLLAQAAPAEPVQLNMQQRASLRCSAAFALISFGQSNKNEEAMKWPELDTRGREFFVRTAAKLIDETGASREQITELMGKEAQALIDDDQVEAVMPACLLMLETSGL